MYSYYFCKYVIEKHDFNALHYVGNQLIHNSKQARTLPLIYVLINHGCI